MALFQKHIFLQKRMPGMTEYFAKKTNSEGNEVMLIFNKDLAVSPITTHLHLKKFLKKLLKEIS